MLGLAAGLTEPGILDELCGKILLVAVPAEELIEIEYREELRKKGVLVRHFTNPKICEYNRITIGSKEQMEAFVEKITEIVKG